LTFTITGAGTATLSGTPTNSNIGPHLVVLRVTDGVISTPVEQSFTINVGDVNDAPAFTSAPITSAGESVLYTYNVVAADPDAGNTLAISATTLPSWLTLVDNGNRTATLSGTPNSSQIGIPHNVVLEVTDGTLFDNQTFTITVANTAPQVFADRINSLPDTGDGVLGNSEVAKVGITQLFVTFNQDVFDPANDGDAHDVTNPANYLLVRDNGDGFQTIDCATLVNALDTAITVDAVSYSNGGGSGPFVSTLLINGGLPLSNGNYRLFVCGTTSIVDRIDNTLELAGNGTTPGTDFILNFTVSIANNGNSGSGSGGGKKTNKGSTASTTSGLLIPVTGFAPNQTTLLPAQPANKAYKPLNEFRIEIPTLGINFPIVGAAVSDNSWDLTWLKDNVAYLEGSAYPTLAGNTVLTAHVTDANNNLGPFSDIKGMQLGQYIYIHSNGQTFVYQVQANRRISPSNISTVFKHEEYDWITLVTCEDYNAKTKSYNYRRMVRAVLISVVPEK
jgi:LPXTG-site transpeptidase (sortase) family protein